MRDPTASPGPSRGACDPVRGYRLPLEADERALLGLARPAAAAPPEGVSGWETLAGLAHRHRLEARVHRAAERLGLPVPEAIASRWRSAYFREVHANERLLRLRDEAIRVLAGAGIRAMVVKGAALADTLYEDAAFRPMGDIDLLLPPGTGPPGLAALRAAGIDPRCLEIEERHHDLTMDGIYRFDFAAAWRDAVPAPFAGGAALVPCREDQLLLVAISCCRNGFWSLVTLLDAAELLHRHGSALDWDRLERRVRAIGLPWALDTVLALSSALFDVDAPAGFRARIAPPEWRRRIIARLLAGYRLAGEPGLESVHIDRPMGPFALKYAVNRPAVVARQLWRVAFPPWLWMRAHYPRAGRAGLILRYALHPFVLLRLGLRFLFRRRR